LENGEIVREELTRKQTQRSMERGCWEGWGGHDVVMVEDREELGS
jgi:hypothetical protein